MVELRQFDENRTFGVEIEAYVPGNRNINDIAADIERLAGVRVAVRYTYNHDILPAWKLSRDGSLRADGTTFELVSPVLKGREGLDEVRRVCEALNLIGAKVNKTCGLHVHHDARDFTRALYFANLLRLYGRMEYYIDHMMPPSRRANNNRYCKSIAYKLELDGHLLDSCKTTEEVREWLGCDRYHKVNLEAWWRQGTIEFRHHSGTVEAEKIVNWIVLTQLILRAARTTRRIKYENWRVRVQKTNGKRSLDPWFELGLRRWRWEELDQEVRDAILWARKRHEKWAAAA